MRLTVSMVYTLLQATVVCSPSPTEPLDFSPAFEILTFSSVTFPPDYLVTDASDFAFLLGQESEIEYFEASSENRDSDHLRKKWLKSVSWHTHTSNGIVVSVLGCWAGEQSSTPSITLIIYFPLKYGS